MKRRNSLRGLATAAALAVLLLMGCSGGGGSPTAPPVIPPTPIGGLWEGFWADLFISFQFNQTGGTFTGTLTLGEGDDAAGGPIQGTVDNQGQIQWQALNFSNVCEGGDPSFEGDLQVDGDSASGVATWDTRTCDDEDVQILVVDTMMVSRPQGGASSADHGPVRQRWSSLGRVFADRLRQGPLHTP